MDDELISITNIPYGVCAVIFNVCLLGFCLFVIRCEETVSMLQLSALTGFTNQTKAAFNTCAVDYTITEVHYHKRNNPLHEGCIKNSGFEMDLPVSLQ